MSGYYLTRPLNILLLWIWYMINAEKSSRDMINFYFKRSCEPE